MIRNPDHSTCKLPSSYKSISQNRYSTTFCNLQICNALPLAFSSVQFSHSVVSDSLQPHESQNARPPCPSPTPRVHANPCASSRWCHPAISSSVVPFSSCPQSLPASGSFPMSQLFTWGGQSIGVSASASVLPMNTQDWSPLGWTGLTSLQSEGLSRVFSKPKNWSHPLDGHKVPGLATFRASPTIHPHNNPLISLNF